MPAHDPKVVIIGSYQSGGLASSAVRGFRLAHANVVHLDYPRVARWVADLPIPGHNRLGGYAARLARFHEARQLIEAARKLRPALVLMIKCDDLPPGFYDGIRAACPGSRLASFHPDDPFNNATTNPGRQRGPSDPLALHQLRAVDHVFLWSRANCERAGSVGAKAVSYLPFACDPELHPAPDKPDAVPGLECDVSFIGNWDPEREAWLAAVAKLNVELAIWGTDLWRTRCTARSLAASWRGEPLVGERFVQAARASKINLNILRRQNKRACNMRTFELPCAGGFMLHEESAEAEAIFPAPIAADYFGNPEALCAKVAAWLPNREGRARAAAKAREIALKHTYAQWAQFILDRTLGTT
jgi:hypothetical protein